MFKCLNRHDKLASLLIIQISEGLDRMYGSVLSFFRYVADTPIADSSGILCDPP